MPMFKQPLPAAFTAAAALAAGAAAAVHRPVQLRGNHQQPVHVGHASHVQKQQQQMSAAYEAFVDLFVDYMVVTYSQGHQLRCADGSSAPLPVGRWPARSPWRPLPSACLPPLAPVDLLLAAGQHIGRPGSFGCPPLAFRSH